MKENVALTLAVHKIMQHDQRYEPSAYGFLVEALAHTVQMLDREDAEDRHVSGPELLVGFRDLALAEYGPVAIMVLHEWGIRESEDVGRMVFNLIENGYFGKNDDDTIEDFSDGVPLEETMKKPFIASRRAAP